MAVHIMPNSHTRHVIVYYTNLIILLNIPTVDKKLLLIMLHFLFLRNLALLIYIYFQLNDKILRSKNQHFKHVQEEIIFCLK